MLLVWILFCISMPFFWAVTTHGFFLIVSFFALKHDSGLLRISAWEAGVFVWQAYSEIE